MSQHHHAAQIALIDGVFHEAFLVLDESRIDHPKIHKVVGLKTTGTVSLSPSTPVALAEIKTEESFRSRLSAWIVRHGDDWSVDVYLGNTIDPAHSTMYETFTEARDVAQHLLRSATQTPA